MGGADHVLEEARSAFDRGEYRWVAEIVNHVVFADANNQKARALQADTLEQMGYQAESGSWRGHFLTGAQELRHGTPNIPIPGTATPDSVRAMSLTLLFNYLGVRLNGPDAAGKAITLNFAFSDTGDKAVLELRNGSLNHSLNRTDPTANATVTLTRETFNKVIVGETDLLQEANNGTIKVEPDIAPLADLVGLLDTFQIWFNIIEP